MSSSRKAWLPAGLPSALAVQSLNPPAKPLYRDLLEQKLQRLIDADRPTARRLMQMSPEDAPGLWAIAEQNPIEDWASAMVRSDQMTSRLALSSWPPQPVSDEQPSLAEVLEALA